MLPLRDVRSMTLTVRRCSAIVRLAVFAALTVAAIVWYSLQPRFGQDIAYHRFADTRELFGVPNALDVFSNAPFTVIGIAALLFLARHGRTFIDPRERLPWTALFVGVALTGFGSAWYHLAPDNGRLVWDRLPMTLGFMGLFAALAAERVSVRLGIALLPALLAAGVASVVYWHVTEAAGQGDLRPYYFVQFYPLLVIPLLLIVFGARYTGAGHFALALGFYLAAKLVESRDGAIYGLGGVLSGHSLKHLLAAVAVWLLLRMLQRRSPVSRHDRP